MNNGEAHDLKDLKLKTSSEQFSYIDRCFVSLAK
ncbi:unnamed protein product [Chironomus riparius]|uniref:Uncharacterized protein n=1 Tax=Chironomus riparius TaxID=315576 RepID=A0A9N9RXH0_9DIPT|nr:unnamed protein product [Chironomus riparius]